MTTSSLRFQYSIVTLFAAVTILFLMATVFQERTTRNVTTSLPAFLQTRHIAWEHSTQSDDVKNLNETQSVVKDKLDTDAIRLPLKGKSIHVITEPPVTEDPKSLIDRRVAESVRSKVRVLCWIPSREIYRNTRLKAVNETWTKRCDKTIFFMTSPKKKSHDVVGVNINDSRRTLTEKTVYAHKYFYQHYLEDFDWFMKADDDTYVIMENLRFLLMHFDPKVPGYIGCQFLHFSPQGYMSGGAGYLFNRQGLKQLVENGYNRPARCRLEGGAEDIETGRCAYKAGVRTLNQLDIHKRETFFPFNVYATAPRQIPDWARSYMRNTIRPGEDCCSQLLVSFHYMGTKLMYLIDFLLYRVTVHGRRFMDEKAYELFDGKEAADMKRSVRRRPYPGETLDEYYEKGWREKNTTIYINPNL